MKQCGRRGSKNKEIVWKKAEGLEKEKNIKIRKVKTEYNKIKIDTERKEGKVVQSNPDISKSKGNEKNRVIAKSTYRGFVEKGVKS